MSHCLSVTETLCSSSPAIKANPEFSKYLSMSMEMYFALLDDQDSGRVYRHIVGIYSNLLYVHHEVLNVLTIFLLPQM